MSIICLFCLKRVNKLTKVFSINVKFSRNLNNAKNKDKSKKNKYSETVLLPKSNYPMKHSRNLELNILNEISFCKLYKHQQQCHEKPVFSLHDGPPYANGSVHFGHAVNKILKDMICRRKMLEGFRVEFTPGWDCHGLPIELKTVTENTTLNPLEIRQKAKQLAIDVIEEQKKSFIKWAVMADWDNPYLTFDSHYIQNEMKAFYELLDKGLVFRDYMPVYWSPSTQTALAEAELQYNDNHISKSVYTKFKLRDVPSSIRHFENIYALIWTTTPWTLPANEAIAYATNQIYAVVTVNRLSDDYLLVAKDLIPNLQKQFDSQIDIKHEIHGSALECVKYTNPIGLHKERLPFLESQHVKITKGTGLVHIAPNHGLEDYKLIVNHNIPLKDCIVNEKGCYVSSLNSQLNDKFVLNEGNESVINALGNALLYKHDFTHSYPYDWRTNKPVIIRASLQWFLNVDAIRDDCIKALQDVKFYPDFHKETLINQLRTRPNWCISRQRSWGVPIPVFYKKDYNHSKAPVITKQISDHISKLLFDKGCDIWWQSSTEELLPKDSQINHKELVKGNDIFDIWFDSGMSWNTALKEPQIADIYLEGVDQLRGWFQSSLILSVALRNCSPFKSVLIHGFALDKDGKKMSKSIGNVIDPNSILENNTKPNNNCGADGLRWWIAAHASHHSDVKVSKETFEDTLNNLNKIRNVIRFLIGSLHEFNAAEHVCHLNEMTILDKYMLHQLHRYLNDIDFGYESLQFSHVINKTIQFICCEVSAFYCTRIKHRLYCKEKYGLERRSCQTVLLYLYNAIVHQLSPILPHIMLEANKHFPINKDFITNNQEWNQQSIEQSMKIVLSFNELLLKEFASKPLIQFDCYIKTSDPNSLENLSLFQSEKSSCDSQLCEILQMSSVSYGDSALPQSAEQRDGITLNVSYDNGKQYELLITSAKNYLCDRCRRYVATNRTQPCNQCLHVLASLWS